MTPAPLFSHTVKGFAAAEAEWFKAHARQYYRCGDCLAVVALDGTRQDLERSWGESAAGQAQKAATGGWVAWGVACGACAGRMEYMGEVGPDPRRLVTKHEDTPCDDRCTMARGPACECKCGGKNHGSHLVLVVTRDAGGRPTVTPAGDTAKQKALGDAFRALRDAVRDELDRQYGPAMRAKAAGWVEPATFARYLDGRRAFDRYREACAMRSHAGRNRALSAMLPHPEPAEQRPTRVEQIGLLNYHEQDNT